MFCFADTPLSFSFVDHIQAASLWNLHNLKCMAKDLLAKDVTNIIL